MSRDPIPAPDPKDFTAEHGVTPREWEALIALAVTGHNRPAAEMMGISEQTFKNHLSHARRRVQAGHLLDTYRRVGLLILPGEIEGAHAHGEAHVYRLECSLCGQRGVIRVSVDPEYWP